MTKLSILTLGAALAHAACVPVSSARIVAGDLAESVPVLRSLDPATPLGFAPLPGTQRIFTARELVQVLKKNGLASDAGAVLPDVCAERWVVPLKRAAIEEALAVALGVADAEIELIDFSSQPVPPGQLEFRRDGLNQPPEAVPNAPVLWRGRLIYDEHRSACLWARVRISVERTAYVASENIPAGSLIASAQVRTITDREFPFVSRSLPSPELIVGKIARRNIAMGQKFTLGQLDSPPDVRRGDQVLVKVIDGLASLSLEAVAQSSGKKGDTIVVHNPSSGRNFRALISEKGEAVVASRPGA